MHPAGPPDVTTAQHWLENAPTALLAVDAAGRLLWANAHARGEYLLAAPGQPWCTLWALNETDTAACRHLLQTQAATALVQRRCAGHPLAHLQVQAQPQGGGQWLLNLQDQTPLHTARAEARKLNELLDVARTMGRIGVWERDGATGRGRWDRQVFRMRGMDGEGDALPLDIAMQHVLEADREGLQRVYQASLARPGKYAHRFRLRGVDGQLRQLQSNWLVKPTLPGEPGPAVLGLGLIMDDTQAWSLARSYSETLEQLSLAVELAGIVVWRHELQTNRVHYNQHGFEVLCLAPRAGGVPLDEVRALVHPADLGPLEDAATAAMQSDGPVVTEARYRQRDGQYRTLLMRRGLQRDSEGRPLAFIGVALDVTERLEAQRRAVELGRRFELATRAAGIGYWSLEEGQERASWSDQLRAIHGLSPDEPVPQQREWLSRWVHPDDRQSVKQRLADWVRSGRNALVDDFRLISSQGEVRYVITHSRVENDHGPMLFGLVIDVTERRQAEAALRQAGERASLAARGAGIGAWDADLLRHTAYWDEQMWRLRGLPGRAHAPDLEERLSLVHPDDRDMMRRLNDATATASYQFRVVWPDGSVRWLASRSTAVRDEMGRVVRRIGVNWDVTDTRTADSVRHQREIAQRESLAKSQFLARMSHELRTPLNAVLGFAQLLKAEENGTDGPAQTRQRRVQHILSAGQHLLELINDVLDLSSLESGEVRIALQPVRLAPVLQQTLPLLEAVLAERGVRLSTGHLDATVMADATRLRQVLLNLLSNAAKYNRDGGQVHVQALHEDGEHGRQVLIQVADTGHGMDTVQLRHLFEPFNRLGAERDGVEGTGIGLAIVKALVERMGGRVSAQSTPGEGSMFEVRLADGAAAPLPVPVPPPVSRPLPLPPAPQVPRGTLLYVEDNPVNALIIAELIGRRQDLTLHLAADGAGGVAEARALLPDLVLLDMQLPDMDGHEVLRQLRADPRTAHIPVIALSANAMPEEIERALQAGMSDYWTKPLDFRAFTASIEGLFGPPPG